MSNHRDNQLLARLDQATFAALEPDLQIAHLHPGDVLSDTRVPVGRVCFPHSGMISCLVEFGNGDTVHTGMVGRDGQLGAGAVLDRQISHDLVVVELSGTASVVDATRFRELAALLPQLHHEAMTYEYYLLAQVQQTAACNAVHKVPQRVCMWLLKMQALVGNELPVTHVSLAQMIGVRRSTVTEAAADLRDAGIISYKRELLSIEDLPQMKAAACECSKILDYYYARAFVPK